MERSDFMKKNAVYQIVESTIKDHHEVLVTFIDENGESTHNVFFIENKSGADEKYYLNEAKKQFALKHPNKPKVKKKHHSKKKTVLVAVLSCVAVAAIATGVTLGVVLTQNNSGQVEEDKFDKMKAYYRDYLIRNTNINNYKDLSAQEIMERGVYWRQDGGVNYYTKLLTKKIAGIDTYYMEDINYLDGSNRDSWAASSHVSQALAIAVTGAVKNDPAITDIATRMTYYWVYNNFRNTNWWHNELGAGANTLANLGIFTYDHLNEQGKSMLVSKVANASFYYRPSLLTHSGTNLFDYADITLRSSIFRKNEEEFNLVVSRIEQEITDEHLEGFQKDGSFFQHGQQVQIASYGKGVIRLAKVLKAMSVSGKKFAEEKMHIIERYLLTGLRNMTHKGYLNYSAVSRELVRKNNLSADANNFSQFSEYLDIPDFTKKEELQAYLDAIKNKEACAEELVYFNRAKMITLNLDGLYMSFKGADSYLTNTECVNSENRLGLNLSYGTNTCVMDEGTEYYNISPLWNYAYIPGTTSIQLFDTKDTGKDEFQNPEAVDERIYVNIVDKIYGDQLYERQLPEADTTGSIVYSGELKVSNSNSVDGDKVAVLMQKSVHHDEHKFTVSCVACKDGMLLLGAGLTYTGEKTGTVFTDGTSSRKLHTTLDQSFYKGDDKFNISPDNKTMTHGNAVYKVIGDNTISIQKPDLNIKNAWARNRNPATGEGDLDAKGKILLAYIQHDGREDESYAYSIQPKSLASKNFVVYNNNGGVQEVGLPDGKTVIMSYMTTTVEAPYKDHDWKATDPNKDRHEHVLEPGEIIIYG